MGWERSSLEALLETEATPVCIGEALDRLLSERALDGAARRLLLYGRNEEEDRFDLLGAFGTSPLPLVKSVPRTGSSSVSRCEAETALQASSSSGEVFLALETPSDLVGFAVLRPLGRERPRSIPESDLWFLARVAGAALARWQRTQLQEGTQRALGSTTRYLERLLALTNDGVILLDSETRIGALNEGAEALLQQYAIDLIGRPLEAVLPAPAATALLAGAELAARQESAVNRIFRLPNLAGEGPSDGRQIEATFERVQLDSDSPPGLLICLRDLDALTKQEWFRRAEDRRDQQLSTLAQSLLKPFVALRGYLALLGDEVPGRSRGADLLQAANLQVEWLEQRLETMALLDQFRARSVIWRDQPIAPVAMLERAFERARVRLESRGIQVELRAPATEARLSLDVEKWVWTLSYLIDEVANHLGGAGAIVAEERPRRVGASRLVLRIRGERATTVPEFVDESEAPVEPAPTLGWPQTRIAHGMSMARTVVHHYGGTILWDWEPGGAAAVTLSIPLESESKTAQS